jgi:hypothetical protein
MEYNTNYCTKKWIPQPTHSKIKNKNRKQKQQQQGLTTPTTEQKGEKDEKWVTFKYHSPLIRKVTPIQTNRIKSSPMHHKYNIPTVGQKTKAK